MDPVISGLVASVYNPPPDAGQPPPAEPPRLSSAPGPVREALNALADPAGAGRMEAARREAARFDALRNPAFEEASRHPVPFASAAVNAAAELTAKHARERIAEGTPDPEDFRRAAEQDRLDARRRGLGTGGQIAAGIARIPALVGEAAVGGAAVRGIAGAAGLGARVAAPAAGEAAPFLSRTGVQQAVASQVRAAPQAVAATPLMPSLYAEEAVRRATEKGGTPLEHLPRAMALAAVQNAVLGTIGKTAGQVGGAGAKGFLARQGARAGAGVAEQSILDVATGAAQKAVDGSKDFDAGYGPLGDVYDGKYGEAARKFAVQAATFAAFGALHAGEDARGPRAVPEKAAAALESLSKAGVPPEEAVVHINIASAPLDRAIEANPAITRKEAADVAKKAPEGPVGDYVRAKAEALPETPPELPKGPLDGIGEQDLKDFAKSVGLTVKGLRERQGEPWVAALADRIKGKPEKPAEAPKTPPAASGPEPAPEARPGPEVTPGAKSEAPEVKLRLIRSGKNIHGEPLDLYGAYDRSGKQVAEAHVYPAGHQTRKEPGDIHVEFLGRPGSSPADPSGGVGEAVNRAVVNAIAEKYPAASQVTGYRESGARSVESLKRKGLIPKELEGQEAISAARPHQWTRMKIKGRTPPAEKAPAAEAPPPAPPADDPFAALAKYGITREPARAEPPPAAKAPEPAPPPGPEPHPLSPHVARAFNDPAVATAADAFRHLKGVEGRTYKAVKEAIDDLFSRGRLERHPNPADPEDPIYVPAEPGIDRMSPDELARETARARRELDESVAKAAQDAAGGAGGEEAVRRGIERALQEVRPAAEAAIKDAGAKRRRAEPRPPEGPPPAPGAGEGDQPAAPPAPAGRGETRRDKLSAVVRKYGGLDPAGHEFRKHFSGEKEAREHPGFRAPGVVRKPGTGKGLDQLARELHAAGYLSNPDPQYLVDKLTRNDSHDARDTPAAHDAALDEHYRALQEHEDAVETARKAGHPAESIAESVRDGEEAARGEVEAAGDTGFDFGENAKPAEAAGPAYERFRDEYQATFRKMMQYHPNQIGSAEGVKKLAEMADAHPEWVEKIESEGTPPERPRPEPAGQRDIFGRVVPAPFRSRGGAQLTMEDAHKAVWTQKAEEFAEEHGLKITKWSASGTFEAGGEKYEVGRAEDGYPVRRVESSTSGPAFPPPPQSQGSMRGGIPGNPGGWQGLPGFEPQKEFAHAREKVTGERAERGLPAVAEAVRRSNPQAWADATALLHQNPAAGEALVASLESNPRPLDSTELATLLLRRVALANQHFAALTEYNSLKHQYGFDAAGKMTPRFTPAELEPYRRRVEDAEAGRDRLDEAVARAGTELGRGLQFFRQLAREDYSLGRMMASAAKAKGAPLTDAEKAEVTKHHEAIQKAEADLEKENTADTRIAAARARRAYAGTLDALSGVNRSTPEKILRGLGEAGSAARSLITAFDLSAVFRQGGFLTFSRPLQAARAVPEMLRSFASQDAFDRARDALDQRPNAPLYRQAGLYLAETAGPLAAGEEAFLSRWAGKVPGVKASERAYAAFLNRVRADTFDAMTASVARGGRPTVPEAKAVAHFVNVATGRGSLGALERAAVPLAHVFFSPRYMASRFQLLAGTPLYGGTAATRKAVAAEYARALAGLAAFYVVMKAANDDAEITFDPRSSDFGKVKIGNFRVDPLAGLAQATVFPARLLTGETKSTNRAAAQDVRGQTFGFRPPLAKSRDTAGDVIWRFLRSKLAPLPGVVVDALSGEGVGGEKVTAQHVAKQAVVPISVRDVWDALKDQGVPRGVAISLLAILGMGTQLHERPTARAAG